jgi:hypothetical protein
VVTLDPGLLPGEVNYVETIFELPGTGAAFSELVAMKPESDAQPKWLGSC